MKTLHNVHLFVLIIIICGILFAPVNAKDDNSTYVGMKNGKTVALEAKSIRSPHLQFKNTQQYVKITGEMSQKEKFIPAEISKNIAVAQNDVMQTLSETTIPEGAIIHHSPSGVTTVFDANGNQILAAKDADAKKMATPFDSVPITFVNEVPNNSIIYNDNNGTIHVFYNDTRILTITNNTNYGISDSHISSSGIPVSGQACVSNGYPIQYIEGAETQFIPSVGQFTARWNVPTPPAHSISYGSHDNLLDYFGFTIWNGLYSCESGDSVERLVQPVLEYNWRDDKGTSPSSAEYTMSTWYVYNYYFDHKGWVHSDRVRGPVPGDQIQGNIEVNSNGYDAIASITDLGPNGGGSSILYLTENSEPQPYPTTNLAATVVVEFENNNILLRNELLDSSYLPGPVTFNNFILSNSEGHDIRQSYPMTHFINTEKGWNVTKYGLSVNNQWPNSIALNTGIQSPVASFTSSSNSGSIPLAVTFTDTSTGTPTSWSWEFGDGQLSTLQNPTHTYSYVGSFPVRLTITNGAGSNTNIQNNYIVVSPPAPTSSFTATPRTGPANLSVAFTDTSTGSPTSWNWSFGDSNNTNATQKNPVHTYSTNGTYTVNLTVSNTGGSNTTTKGRYICVGDCRDKIGVVRFNTTWLLDASGNGLWGPGDYQYVFGRAGDRYITGDWTGTGTTKIGVFRDTNTWLLDASGDGSFGTGDLQYIFGIPGDVPVTGDWNGNGMTRIGVVRNNRTWILDASGNGLYGPGDLMYSSFGTPGDVYVTGDWTGTGTTRIGVVRFNTTWLLDASGDGLWGPGDSQYVFGKAGDRYVTGDWNNDRKTEIGVVRDNKTWILDASGNGLYGEGDIVYNYGISDDRYITGDWS